MGLTMMQKFDKIERLPYKCMMLALTVEGIMTIMGIAWQIADMFTQMMACTAAAVVIISYDGILSYMLYKIGVVYASAGKFARTALFVLAVNVALVGYALSSAFACIWYIIIMIAGPLTTITVVDSALDVEDRLKREKEEDVNDVVV